MKQINDINIIDSKNIINNTTIMQLEGRILKKISCYSSNMTENKGGFLTFQLRRQNKNETSLKIDMLKMPLKEPFKLYSLDNLNLLINKNNLEKYDFTINNNTFVYDENGGFTPSNVWCNFYSTTEYDNIKDIQTIGLGIINFIVIIFLFVLPYILIYRFFKKL